MISQPSTGASCPWGSKRKEQTIAGVPWCSDQLWQTPCLRTSSQTLSKLPVGNNGHCLFASPVHKLPWPAWTPPKGRLHLNLVFSLPQVALLEPNPFSWPPCWMRCTLVSENADLCLKPPCRQFPRHGSTVYLFIFMLAKRRKSHGPKMNTNEMPSLASFVIRMKNRISAELQAMYFFPFLSPKHFFFLALSSDRKIRDSHEGE